MSDKVIIEFVADTTNLETANSSIEKLGTTEKKVLQEMNSNLAKNKAEQKAVTDTINKTTKSVEDLTKAADKFEKAGAGKVGIQTFEQLAKEIGKSETSMQALNITATKGKELLANATDKGSEQYKKLQKEVKAAEIALNSFGQDQEKIQSKIRNNTQALFELQIIMAKLKKDGQGGTDIFKGLLQEEQMLTRETAELKDQIGDLKGKLSQLSQDNTGFKALAEGAATLSAGMQIAQGATLLFGEENKEFQQNLLRLNALMAVTQGLQQLSSVLLDQSTLKTYLQITAQKAYNFVVGESIGAMAALKVALATITGVAIIAGIYVLVKAFSDWNKETRERTKAISDAKKAGSEYYASETTKLTELLQIARDKNISDATRNEAFKKINELYPEYLKNLNADNIGLASSNELIKKQTDLIQKLAILKGSTKVLEDLGQKIADVMSQVGNESATSRFTTALSSGFAGIWKNI